jgi:hypothetical protein
MSSAASTNSISKERAFNTLRGYRVQGVTVGMRGVLNNTVSIVAEDVKQVMRSQFHRLSLTPFSHDRGISLLPPFQALTPGP